VTVLVHYLQGTGPVGVWRIRRNITENVYAPGTNKKVQQEAHELLDFKGKDQSWQEVFEYAISRSPYGSQYFLTPYGDDSDELEYVLRKVQRLSALGKLKILSSYPEDEDSDPLESKGKEEVGQ